MKRQPTTTKTRFAHFLRLYATLFCIKFHLIRLNKELQRLSRILNSKTAFKSVQTPRKTHKNGKQTENNGISKKNCAKHKTPQKIR